MEKHLTFKGVPINETLDVFVGRLNELGFTQVSMSKDEIVMEGPFCGKQCKAIITASVKTGIVYNASVYVEKSAEWFVIKAAYYRYKLLLAQKYGNGESIECFLYPYSEGGGNEDKAMKDKRCHYMTSFHVPRGEISLVMEWCGEFTLVISYKDCINGELAEDEEDDMMLDDL
ncbi:MAG: hypothetical protein IKT29_04890 [Flavobacteriales bacterium]|nr:hypothetical protein [Flavobacteriales bacterium]